MYKIALLPSTTSLYKRFKIETKVVNRLLSNLVKVTNYQPKNLMYVPLIALSFAGSSRTFFLYKHKCCSVVCVEN